MTLAKPFEIADGEALPLMEWAKQNVPIIQRMLAVDGLCWLRGLYAPEPDLAQRMVTLVGGPLMEDVFWSTPRSRVTDKTFTATEYPARETIPLHSEMAYLSRYPRLLCFHALECAQTGGQTTVADLDEISDRLGNITVEFRERGVRYVRVVGDGIDIPITTAFGTDDRAAIDELARAQGMHLEQAADGAVRLVHVAQGALLDARDDHPIWFNQMHLSHPARLPAVIRDNLALLFTTDGLPRQAYFGDGEAIPDDMVRTVGETLAREAMTIDWRPGDIVLIDNLRYAHGRQPFTGQRTVHVAMGMPQSGDLREPLFPNLGR